MKVGLLGGTFDPVHYGHLILADVARESCGLDQVWFVPAAIPPHKQGRGISSAAHRVAMLNLAIGGNESFAAATIELDRGGVSFTVDTLEQLKAEDAGRELCLILGSDSLADLPTWRSPARICELATLIVARRGGAPEADFNVLGDIVDAARLALFARQQIEMPRIEISATELRQRVAAGQSIRYRTPRAVEKYIETEGLYRELVDEPTTTPTCAGRRADSTRH